MDLVVCQKLVNELMTKHGLIINGWTFRFSRSKTFLGTCKGSIKIIFLSWMFVKLNNEDEIRNTIFHEIAHALVGTSHKHDYVWKMKCLEIGAIPDRLNHTATIVDGHWKSICPSCHKEYSLHRKPKRLNNWYCKKCGKLNGKLEWKDTRFNSILQSKG
jgi:predicted SprT family Zn-dependent metalloprotease